MHLFDLSSWSSLSTVTHKSAIVSPLSFRLVDSIIRARTVVVSEEGCGAKVCLRRNMLEMVNKLTL